MNGINPITIDVRVKDIKGAKAYHSALECDVNTLGVVDMENNLSIR
jgi:hypothetical protein